MKDRRGRAAESPKEIPARGWKDVMMRVKDQVASDNIGVVAAGVAFYFFLALFPFLTLIISVYGLVTDPGQVEQHMEQMTNLMPAETREMLTERLQSIAEKSSDKLGWGVILGILISLWSANSGTKSMFEGVNIAYDQEETRGFLKLNGLTLLFTLGGIVIGSICAALVIGFPALVGKLGLPETLQTVISLGRWPLLFAVVMFSISLLYKIAPNRDNPKFKWVSWGSAIATTLWVLGSLLFSFYVTNFGEYGEAYGPIASVVILMLWFNLTTFIILLGAEINSELEHQTAKDTTVGPDRPLGQRNAYHADHVAGEGEGPEVNEENSKNKDKIIDEKSESKGKYKQKETWQTTTRDRKSQERKEDRNWREIHERFLERREELRQNNEWRSNGRH